MDFQDYYAAKNKIETRPNVDVAMLNLKLHRKLQICIQVSKWFIFNVPNFRTTIYFFRTLGKVNIVS